MAVALLPRLLVLLGTLGAVGAQLNSLHPVAGDFVLRANISQCQRNSANGGSNGDANSGKDTLEVVFDAVSGGNYTSYSLQPSTGTIELLRYRHGDRVVLQTTHSDPASWRPGAAPSFSAKSPLVVELVRRGTFYLLYLGGSHLTSQPVTYVERPSSDVICNNGVHLVDQELEPLRSSAGIKDVSGGVFQLNSFNVTEYRWESAPLPTAPVLSHCSNCGIGCDAFANHTETCWAYNRKCLLRAVWHGNSDFSCCHNRALTIACNCSMRRNYPWSTAARSQRLSPRGRAPQRQRRAVRCWLGLGWDGRWRQATHGGGNRSISPGALPSLAVPAGGDAGHT